MISAPISIPQAAIYTTVRNFLLSVLPAGVEVFQGQTNRVPEPSVQDFVSMIVILQSRLSFNQDEYSDVAFIGSISGSILDVTKILQGQIAIGQYLSGENIAAGTEISGLGTGTGGIGAYTVIPAQNVVSETIQAGVMESMQETQFTVQLDIHGPNSADNSQIITTLFRDGYAADMFSATGFDIAPLYANDPKQLPFLNGEQQIEQRWVVELVLQANPVVSVPQQFADAVSVPIHSVNSEFLP